MLTASLCGNLSWSMKDFIPLRLLRNPHLMTLAAAFWPRRCPHLSRSTSRLFETEPGTRLRGDCHWQESPTAHPTLVLVHGLEGSSDSGYMLGTAEKAFQSGFNVVRLNQRNCGGTENLTKTLYNSGLSCDYHAVIRELIEKDQLTEIFAAGFSMGGNLVLKMAAEFGSCPPAELRGIAAICPSLDLARCADAVGARRNFIYERHFVRSLKRRMRYKAKLFPNLYSLDCLRDVRTLHEFDDRVTARFCGFRDASDYYERSSASRLIAAIHVPTLILTAKDDPMVPFDSFLDPAINGNSHVQLVAAQRGGHCGFISKARGTERFWSESRIVEFCVQNSDFTAR